MRSQSRAYDVSLQSLHTGSCDGRPFSRVAGRPERDRWLVAAAGLRRRPTLPLAGGGVTSQTVGTGCQSHRGAVAAADRVTPSDRPMELVPRSLTTASRAMGNDDFTIYMVNSIPITYLHPVGIRPWTSARGGGCWEGGVRAATGVELESSEATVDWRRHQCVVRARQRGNAAAFLHSPSPASPSLILRQSSSSTLCDSYLSLVGRSVGLEAHE